MPDAEPRGKEAEGLFYKYPEIPMSSLSPEKAERIEAIADGLPESHIVDITRRMVRLKLPNIDEPIDGDVTQSGITIYLGGFDWVTFTTPPHLLQKFPEFLPLPQQIFRPADEEV
jgi:hypothetical protein